MRRCIAAAIVALSLLLGACSGPGAPAEGPATLRLAWWGNDLRNRLTNEVIDLFHDRHPDIRVELEPGEWSAYWDKLATQMAGNDAPDVFAMDESQIATFSQRATLLDLESRPEELDLSSMQATVLDTGRVDGVLTGAPVGIAIMSIATNPDVLAAAGVEMPDDTTWTWEQFKDISAQVTANSPEGTYGLDRFGLGTGELGYFARQRGEEAFPRADETPLSRETVLAFLDLVQAMETDGAVPGFALQSEDSGLPVDAGLFGSGKAAFHILFHTQVQAFASAAGTEMTLLRLPAVTPGEPHMANKASMYWSISARTPRPDAAATLVSFLMTDPEAAAILKVERGVPAIPEIQDEIEPLLDDMGQLNLRFARDMQPELDTPPQVTPPGAGTYGTEFTRIIQAYTFGQLSRDAAADQIMALVESLRA